MDNGIRHFKREPSVHIKSESNPSLASIPMAPTGPITAVKKEPSRDSKMVRRSWQRLAGGNWSSHH